MIRERHYVTWLQRVVLSVGALTLVFMVLASWRLWPVVSRAFWSPVVNCGCGTVQIHQSPWMIGLAVAMMVGTLATIVFGSWRFGRILISAQRFRRLMQRRVMSTGSTEYQPLDVPERLAVTVGLLRPKIFVSRGAIEALTSEELRAVVAHEQAHQTHRDPLAAALIDSLSAAFPWVPGLRTWTTQLATWRELAADAEATHGYDQTQALATAFLKFSEVSYQPGLVGFSANRDRLERLLDRSWSPRRPRRSWLTMTSALVALGVMIGLTQFVRAATPSTPVQQACRETIVMCALPHTSTPSASVRCSTNSCVVETPGFSSIYVAP